MTLNFSSLSKPISNEDVQAFEAYASTENFEASTSRYLKAILIATIAINVVLLLQMIVMSIVMQRYVGGFGVIIIFVISICVAIIYIVTTRFRKKQLALLYRFAVENNAHLIANLANPGYVGTVFEEGNERVIKEALVFSDGKEIGNYTYTKGSGKNKSTHNWGYMRVKLTRRLPHMILDAKNNNFFGNILSNLPATFTKNQTMRLEGNFNDYFTLYVPEGYERDALYVFTPDVMSTLIDFGSHYDMEVIDDNLVFYTGSHYHLNSEKNLREALDILDKISTEILDQSDYYADARTGDRVANIVAEPGRRLKSRFNIIVIIIIFILLFYFLTTILGPALTYHRFS